MYIDLAPAVSHVAPAPAVIAAPAPSIKYFEPLHTTSEARVLKFFEDSSAEAQTTSQSVGEIVWSASRPVNTRKHLTTISQSGFTAVDPGQPASQKHLAAVVGFSTAPGAPRRGPGFQLKMLIRVCSRKRLGPLLSHRY